MYYVGTYIYTVNLQEMRQGCGMAASRRDAWAWAWAWLSRAGCGGVPEKGGPEIRSEEIVEIMGSVREFVKRERHCKSYRVR